VAKERTALTFGRKLLGTILREFRKAGGLPTSFANRLDMKDAMIRMIETGHADLPIKRIPDYVSALNSSARNGLSLDPEALALAYASLRSLAAYQSVDDRFNWRKLSENEDFAQVYVREQLTRSPAGEAFQDSKKRRSEFENLNPIQRLMISDIAKRIGAFGSDIITEEAIIEWEKANANQIRVVRAAVASLGSELEPGFVRSIGAISCRDEFVEWRYLVATDDQHLFEAAENTFKEVVRKSDATSDEKKAVIAKFKLRRVAVEEFRRIGKVVGANSSRGWDAIYLYDVKSGPDLLIGVFRRCPPLTARVPPLKLDNWGCIPVNEALRWTSTSEFTKVHGELWSK
jgi:hypothetical protein